MNANTDGATLSVSAPSTDDSSKFLSLPPELVARVTRFVNSEALIPVRLTCKVLEHFTFDRFATENFEHIYCWVHTTTDFERLKNILRQSPHLGRRIRQLTLTTDALRGRPLETMNFVRNENAADWRARESSVRCLYGVEQCDIGVIAMLRTLQNLHEAAFMNNPTHSIRINVDLISRHLQSTLGLSVAHSFHSQQATLFSLAFSFLNVHSLTIDKCTFDSSDDLLAFGRDGVLESMSDLDTLVIKGGAYTAMSIAILEGASQLRSLALDVGSHKLYPEEEHSFDPIAPEFLLANPLSNLTSLRISSAILDGALFIQMLKRCQATLTHLMVRWVCLTTNDDDLMPVHAMMLEMPELVFFELQWIQAANIIPYAMSGVPDGCDSGVCPDTHKYEGKEEIKAWLRDLLDNYLYLYHKKPDPEQ
jgi:hypothetical protein